MLSSEIVSVFLQGSKFVEVTFTNNFVILKARNFDKFVKFADSLDNITVRFDLDNNVSDSQVENL